MEFSSGRRCRIATGTASPSFQHVQSVPILEQPGGIVRVFSGNVDQAASPALHFSDLVGADLQVHRGESLAVPLRLDFEYAVLVLTGDCVLDGQPLHERVLYYLGMQRTQAAFASQSGARVLLVGGPPFPGNDSDVVELRGADSGGDPRCARRLGKRPPLWHRHGLQRAAPSRARARATGAPQSGELTSRGLPLCAPRYDENRALRRESSQASEADRSSSRCSSRRLAS